MSHFKAKMHQIRLQRSPDSLAGFKGPTSKGRGGREEGKAGERGREGEGKKGKGGKGWEKEGEGEMERGRGGEGKEGREGRPPFLKS